MYSFEKDLIKAGRVIQIWKGPFKVDGRRRRRRRRIGNPVVDIAAQIGFGWLGLRFKLGLGCSLIEYPVSGFSLCISQNFLCIF